MKTTILAIGLSLILPTVAARADQCALVPKAQAVAALDRLEVGQTIYRLCEICGEQKPSKVVINKLSLVTDQQTNLVEVKVNDHSIDFAYTYIAEGNQKPGSWVNLSTLTNCSAEGYTPIISIK
jgi:hypothetical protein